MDEHYGFSKELEERLTNTPALLKDMITSLTIDGSAAPMFPDSEDARFAAAFCPLAARFLRKKKEMGLDEISTISELNDLVKECVSEIATLQERDPVLEDAVLLQKGQANFQRAFNGAKACRFAEELPRRSFPEQQRINAIKKKEIRKDIAATMKDPDSSGMPSVEEQDQMLNDIKEALLQLGINIPKVDDEYPVEDTSTITLRATQLLNRINNPTEKKEEDRK